MLANNKKFATTCHLTAFTLSLFAHTAQAATVPGEFIVHFATTDQRDLAAEEQGATGVEILARFNSSPSLYIKVDDLAISTESLRMLWDGVKQIEPNRIVYLAKTVPNDPRFPEQYSLKNDRQTNGKQGADIDAAKAWDIETGDGSAVVAIIDTGIEFSHPDLKDNIWTNPGEIGTDRYGRNRATNGVDDDGNGYVDDWRGWDYFNNDNDPTDDNGHGTHCAGIIGAAGDNGEGITGINWRSALVALKFLGKDGSGTTANAIRATEYATSMGFDVLNNSWADDEYSPALHAAIRAAAAKNLLYVAAAGNAGTNNDTKPQFPANYAAENVISVAATDNNDTLTRFSQWGPQTVHLAAPGAAILSTWIGGTYQTASGTSMAAPHVSGAAALLWSRHPEMPVQEVKRRILERTDKLPTLKGKVLTGGRLNLHNVVDDDTEPPAAVSDLRVTGTELDGVRLRWGAVGDDGNEGDADHYEMRWSSQSIKTMEDWRRAQTISCDIINSGSTVLYATCLPMPVNARGFVAIRAFDNLGNGSAVSVNVQFTLPRAEVVFEASGESLEPCQSAHWGVEFDPLLNRKVLSDSPGRMYPPNSNALLNLPKLNLRKGGVLTFLSTYDIEPLRDRGAVEISHDAGQTWKLLATVSGLRDWANHRVVIPQAPAPIGPDTQVRFALKSDGMGERDGWKLATIRLISAP